MQPQLKETLRLRQFGTAIAACAFIAVAIRDIVIGASGLQMLRDIGLAVLASALSYSAWTRRQP